MAAPAAMAAFGHQDDLPALLRDRGKLLKPRFDP
jgi:hypothetical protein